MDFMHGKISLTNDGGAKDLYRFIRFGQGDRVASQCRRIPARDAGQRLSIIKNGVYTTILAMAKMKVPEGYGIDLRERRWRVISVTISMSSTRAT